MNAAMRAILTENLKSLRLSSMMKNLENELRQAQENSIPYEEFLLNLSETEVRHRTENGRKRRIKEAGYLKEKRNIIFMGKSGAGKTHLATALGIEACTAGYRTRFVTGCGLTNELIEAVDKKGLTRMLKRYAGYGLLIVDELGYVPFSKEGSELLFQVLAERHEKRSVIITTNLGFGDWTQVFGDPNLTAALLDRLTHKAHVIPCN